MTKTEYNIMKKPIGVLFSLLLGTLISVADVCFAEDEIIVPVSSEVDITVERFPAMGNYLILWLAPEYGLRISHRSLARSLSDQNIEIWLSNIVESLYLPQNTHSLRQLDGEYVADLIEYAHQTTGKKIIVAGDSYAAISALLGAHQWQQRKPDEPYLLGAILFSPNTYAYIPSLGLPPEFSPVVSATNIPIMIFQATRNANIGQFEELLEKLSQHENPVYSKFVPNVVGLFYDEKANSEIKKNLQSLPADIKKMIAVLARHNVPDKPLPLQKISTKKTAIDSYLKEYKGTNTPFTINLKDVYGNSVVKDDFKGQITLVNFWATWCPPCVQEIPSLNRLQKRMSNLPFELISINYAEERDTILDFLKKVKVEFPVLLDHNGDLAKKWQVITYPSTFVIDTKGKIKYGVNAAIEWDDPDLVEKIKSLL